MPDLLGNIVSELRHRQVAVVFTAIAVFQVVIVGRYLAQRQADDDAGRASIVEAVTSESTSTRVPGFSSDPGPVVKGTTQTERPPDGLVETESLDPLDQPGPSSTAVRTTTSLATSVTSRPPVTPAPTTQPTTTATTVPSTQPTTTTERPTTTRRPTTTTTTEEPEVTMPTMPPRPTMPTMPTIP